MCAYDNWSLRGSQTYRHRGVWRSCTIPTSCLSIDAESDGEQLYIASTVVAGYTLEDAITKGKLDTHHAVEIIAKPGGRQGQTRFSVYE